VALNLAFESLGSGPPLLVLHGLFGSSGNWRGIARQLADAHAVFSVDLRNHGASPWADSMDYTEMADDVRQLIDRLGLERPAVMGHSMGGKTAMALALRHPQHVGQLLVVDIAPLSYADTLTPFSAAMLGIDVLAAASRSEVERRLQEDLADRGVVSFLMQNLVACNDHFGWRMNLMGIRAAMTQLCGFPSALLGSRYEGPVRVIAGEHSDYVTRRDGGSFRPMFARVEVDVIEGAGHWVHADRPAAFLARVRDALRRESEPRTTALR